MIPFKSGEGALKSCRKRNGMTLGEQILALNPGIDAYLCFIRDNHYVLNNPEKEVWTALSRRS